MTGRLIGLEVRGLGGWLAHTRLLWWILVLGVAVPAGMVAESALQEGPIPWLVWAPILCMLPTGLVFAYAGFRRGGGERRSDAGALRSVWLTSGYRAWLVELVGVMAVSGVSALLLAAGVVALSSGGFQGWAAAADVWAMLWLNAALLWSFGLWVGSWWPGPGGAGFLVAVPAAAVVANTALLIRSAPGGVLATSLAAMSPWTALAGDGTDTWGFGGFAGLFHAVAGLSAAAIVLLVGASVRRRLNLPDQRWVMRGPAGTAVLALLALTLRAAWRPGSPSPIPPIQSGGHPTIRMEQIAVQVGAGGSFQAIATVRPAAVLQSLWLNPALTVSAVRVGGKAVRFHRVGGYIRAPAAAASASGAVAVQYGGRLDEWAWSGWSQDPITTAFVSPAGAYLPAGGWYPVVPPDAAQVSTPPVAQYSVSVTAPWAAVLSNLGRLGPTPAGRATTGVSVVAGTFSPWVVHGITLWGGPAELAALRRGHKKMGIDYGPVQHPEASTGSGSRPSAGSQRVLATGISPRQLNAVDLVFGALPTGLLPLGNPNPVPSSYDSEVGSGSPPWVLSVATAFGGANPNFSIPFARGVDQIALMWSAISPHWTRLASFDRPWAKSQRPADRVLVWLLNRWPPLGGNTVGGPFPFHANGFSGLTPAEVRPLWEKLAAAAAGGRWPSARQVEGWRQMARRGAPHA